jgi:GNAT superfamily N-acetyltransferase
MHNAAIGAVTIVDLAAGHIGEAHRLSLQEAWPHRVADWEFMLGFSEGIGALCDGKLVGTALLTPYGATGATCNMIIVDPSMRGIGLGRRLMERVLERAGGRECRLTATASGLPLYEKLGFAAAGEIGQYQGVVAPLAMPDGVSEAGPGDLAALIALDRAAIGLERGALLARLAAERPFLVLRDASGLRGSVSCRAFGRGALAGPLAARDDEAAGMLFQAALASHAGQFLRVDLTGPGMRHSAMIEAAGLVHAGGGVAMIRPGTVRCHAFGGAEIYALASQALC